MPFPTSVGCFDDTGNAGGDTDVASDRIDIKNSMATSDWRCRATVDKLHCPTATEAVLLFRLDMGVQRSTANTEELSESHCKFLSRLHALFKSSVDPLSLKGECR